MKTIDYLIICSILFASITISCESKQSSLEDFDNSSKHQYGVNEPPDGFYTGKIIVMTCGGAAIQFLNTDSIFGEDWINHFGVGDSTSIDSVYLKYSNCVLALNVNKEGFKNGDTLYFKFKVLNDTDRYEGQFFCAIGGLPNTMVELFNIISKTKSQ